MVGKFGRDELHFAVPSHDHDRLDDGRSDLRHFLHFDGVGRKHGVPLAGKGELLDVFEHRAVQLRGRGQ